MSLANVHYLHCVYRIKNYKNKQTRKKWRLLVHILTVRYISAFKTTQKSINLYSVNHNFLFRVYVIKDLCNTIMQQIFHSSCKALKYCSINIHNKYQCIKICLWYLKVFWHLTYELKCVQYKQILKVFFYSTSTCSTCTMYSIVKKKTPMHTKVHACTCVCKCMWLPGIFLCYWII